MDNNTKKILCIEDDEFFLGLLSGLLQNTEGILVLGAHNGTDGVLMAKNEHPDLILLDLMLPDIRGREVLEQIKALDGMADVPVIIFSNLAERAEIDACLSLGAQAYFVKSNTLPSEMVEIVAKEFGIEKLTPPPETYIEQENISTP